MEQSRFDDCMSRICRGEKEALKEIYQEYMKYVFMIVYQMVDSHADAEDITAEFFVKLWTNAEKYIPGSSHKAYLATMARHMAIDFLRKNRREILVSEYTAEPSDSHDEESEAAGAMMVQASAEGNPEQEVIENIALTEALERLKPREREIVQMKVLWDMTFKEIAEATHSPMGTVTWLYRQAINKLRRCGYDEGS